jgi:hypothetical protein
MKNHPFFSLEVLEEHFGGITSSALSSRRQKELRRRVLRGAPFFVREPSTSWVLELYAEPFPMKDLVSLARSGNGSVCSRIIRTIAQFPQRSKKLENEIWYGFGVEPHCHNKEENYAYLAALWTTLAEYMWGDTICYTTNWYETREKSRKLNNQFDWHELLDFLHHVNFPELPAAVRQTLICNVARGLPVFANRMKSSGWMVEVCAKDFDPRSSVFFKWVKDNLSFHDFNIGIEIEYEYSPMCDLEYRYLALLWKAAVAYFTFTLDQKIRASSITKKQQP